MGKHLTDSQKKKIIADYTECENYSQVARKYKVSFDTVKRTVLNDPETVKKNGTEKRPKYCGYFSTYGNAKNTSLWIA